MKNVLNRQTAVVRSPLAVALLMVGWCALLPAVTLAAGKAIANPDAEHRAAVAQARKGAFDVALPRLEALLTAYPGRPAYRHDYISVLAWAGRDAAVLKQAETLDWQRAPAYVLKAIGKSARNQRQPALAVKAYEAAAEKRPRDRQVRLGLAMSLAEAGRAAEADAQMADLLASAPDSLELLLAQAYVKEVDRDFAAAIAIYDRVLRLQPQQRDARRGRIMALLGLGVPHEALRLARRDPEALREADWQRLLGDRAAREIRWGRLPVVDPAERYRDTDSAIATLQEQYRQMPDKDSRAARRNRFDLLSAYRNRRQMRAAVDLYQQLRAQGVAEFPPYVLAAVGDAYLSLRQPQQAVALLEEAVRRYPADMDAQYSLYYAYLEAGRYEDSLAHIDRLAASLPQWRRSPAGQRRELNPDRLYAQTIAAMARAYVDDLAEAQDLLETQLARSPASTDVRSALGSVYLWRGWPRLAAGEYTAVLAQEPDNLGARTGLVGALAARGDIAASDAALAPLLADYGDDPQVRNLARDARVREMRELWMEVNGGASSSIYQGSRDLSFRTVYHDRSWLTGLRPFVSLLYSAANFPEQAIRRNRLAAGLDYQRRDMTLRGSINDGKGATGFALQGDWMPTDHWRAGMAWQSYSEETPLRADLDGIEAWSLAANAEYRFHESRSLGLAVQTMGFDDSNQRNTLTATARQRLFNNLRYRLEGQAFLYHQSNSLAADRAAYFNPSQQDALELGLTGDWLTYSRYDRKLRQRLVLGMGPSYQQGYGTRLTWSVSYEHHWSFSRQLSMSYGISRARPIYDGVREDTTRGFMTLYARF